MAPYDGSGGVVHYTFKGGTANVSRDPYITLFGQGTETDVVATTDANNINGVTELGTAAADNDSVGIAFPNAYRPGIMEDGRLRDAGGTGIVKARFGFDARGNRQFFMGFVKGAPGASHDIDDILTTTAAGVMTFVETDFAGFWYDARLTTDDEFWRTIASGGAKSAASAQVITDKEVKGATAYMNISPELSPVLSVEVNYRGDAEFYWNGERVRLIKDALDPETNYSPILVMQSESASAKKVGVDWFDACWWSYPGPVFP